MACLHFVRSVAAVLAIVLSIAQTGWTADRSLQIISFTSTSCQPCQSMQPILTQLSRDGWQIRQIDVQQQPELIKPFNVTSLPTIIVMHQRREVDRVVGTLGYSKLSAKLEQAAQASSSSALNSSLASTSPYPNAGALAADTTVRGQSPEAFAMASARNEPPRMIEFNAPPSLAASSLSLDERAQRATVRIRVEDANSIAFGTGTVIDMHGEQALVLTCGHLFRDVSPTARLSVDLFDKGQTINLPAQVVWHTTSEGDLGLMEFRSPIAIAAVPVAAAASQAQAGQPAFSLGCDHGADPSRRNTQIKRINRYIGPANIEIVGAPVVGRSGGGLFNAQGELIGVCNAADNEDDEGIYAGLPVIHQHLSALQLDRLHSQPAGPTIAATQLRCTICDEQGRETTLTIDRPTPELLALLKSNSAR